MRARRIAQEEKNEAEAAEIASEWYGITGESFDPATPEPVPFVLEFGVDDDGAALCVFPPGVSFLFRHASTYQDDQSRMLAELDALVAAMQARYRLMTLGSRRGAAGQGRSELAVPYESSCSAEFSGRLGHENTRKPRMSS